MPGAGPGRRNIDRLLGTEDSVRGRLFTVTRDLVIDVIRDRGPGPRPGGAARHPVGGRQLAASAAAVFLRAR
ncbi:hypothetical protein ACIQZN_33030 [Streptomyces sp. NPDC097595]|uniref:hypothetical protein n=1 Tax=Streptomyces sp. NPDC097595 TaxID=3366090 RepID=UPI00380A6789